MQKIYSKDIFKEQNAVIEEKLIAAQNAKNDVLPDNYDIQAITEFIKKKISDLEETYAKSNLSQMQCLLRSIFMSGFTWQYPGCSNDTISPIYQSIRDIEQKPLPFGDLSESLFETFLPWVYNLMKLMDIKNVIVKRQG